MKKYSHLPLSKKTYKLNINYDIYLYKPFSKKNINLINDISNNKTKLNKLKNINKIQFL